MLEIRPRRLGSVGSLRLQGFPQPVGIRPCRKTGTLPALPLIEARWTQGGRWGLGNFQRRWIFAANACGGSSSLTGRSWGLAEKKDVFFFAMVEIVPPLKSCGPTPTSCSTRACDSNGYMASMHPPWATCAGTHRLFRRLKAVLPFQPPCAGTWMPAPPPFMDMASGT